MVVRADSYLKMKPKHLSEFGLPLLGLFLFVLSLTVIYNELKQYQLSEIIDSFQEIRFQRLVLAFFGTIFGYLAITGHDFLAFYYLRRKITPIAILFTAFISYAISNTAGFPILTGAALNYRLYYEWGVPIEEIAGVIAFENLSFWIGLLAFGGMIFVLEPVAIPNLLHLHFSSVQPIGILFLVAVVTYLGFSLRRKRSLTIGKFVFYFPSFKISIAQIVISTIDWGLAISVLYLLLPNNYYLSYFSFASIYLLAMIAGLISNVPGGLGVFESIILLLLPPDISKAELLGSLLAYRLIYYIFPMLIAALMLGVYEIKQKLKKSSRD